MRLRMRYILDALEMKLADDTTTEEFGMDAKVLMERAAFSMSQEIMSRFSKEKKLLIVAGPGNNGADGIAAGRILTQEGYYVDLYLVESSHYSALYLEQLATYRAYGYHVKQSFQTEDYDIIIDAVFGIGLKRDVSDSYADIINRMNQSKAYKIACDISSGIQTDTGKIMGTACKADLTITFGYTKRGHFLGDGKEYTGELICKNIGITDASLKKNPKAIAFTKNDIENGLIKRKRTANKGTCGKLLVIAGSDTVCGAAILASKAAYRSGTGMVRLITHVNNKDAVMNTTPECLVDTYDNEIIGNTIKKAVQWADAVLIGPGIGTESCAYALLQQVLDCIEDQPLVMDADALNIMSKDNEIKEKLVKAAEKNHVVMSPLLKELERLLGVKTSVLREDLVRYAIKAATDYQVEVVAKDSTTVIAGKEQLYINTTGNSGLASAGTGDVLAGIIAGLLAQKKAQNQSTKDAAAIGCFLHGYTADRLISEGNNQYSLMAHDICDYLKEVMGEFI